MGPEITDDQGDVFAFLSDPATHGLASNAAVMRIDTHGAVVFLAGCDVYKVKRAVRFPFMDFSTLEKRRLACENEIRVNRANAPALYLGTIAIRRGRHGLRLGGESGEVIEWAVHMRRFDETATLDLKADRGELDLPIIAELADIILAAHERAPPRDSGTTRVFQRRLAETLAGLAAAADIFPAQEVAELRQRFTEAFAKIETLLMTREAQGKVRHCHGDLHLRNIVLVDKHPVLFDALEFDESLATCDVLYDLAFLLMDLWKRGLQPQANLLFNRYLWHCKAQADELAGLAAMPLFLAQRAAIRARVSAELVALRAVRNADLVAQAQHFFAAARGFLEPKSLQLVGIGGFSGSGKSTLSRRLAAEIGRAPGAVHLRSDIERKTMFGVGEFERLADAAYLPEVSGKIYERLCHLAEIALAAGQSVIVDAVHAKPQERDAVAEVAARTGAKFTGLWLEAPIDVLVSRVAARNNDASDADAFVVKEQAERPLGAMTWTRLQAGVPIDALAREAMGIIGANPSPACGRRWPAEPAG
jgi:aminoglycoside phosphotransferase family enzyme/predicted kinase